MNVIMVCDYKWVIVIAHIFIYIYRHSIDVYIYIERVGEKYNIE